MELADFFAVKHRPHAFRVLPSLGVLKVERDLHFGLVFKPPLYIEKVDPKDKSERGLSKPRLPQTLLERIDDRIIWNERGTLPLGDRFNLARKIARSLYVMHAAGWLHKK